MLSLLLKAAHPATYSFYGCVFYGIVVRRLLDRILTARTLLPAMPALCSKAHVLRTVGGKLT